VSARAEVFYELLESFYNARLVFEAQRDEYEAAVASLVERTGIPREMLWLPPEKLAALLDFKVLSDLRDLYLHPLRQCTRTIFGGEGRDIFDIIVSDIFHMVSILKEEEFRVAHYAVVYDRMQQTRDRDHILTSASHDFPILLNQTHRLFQQAQERLHVHLPAYARERVVIRSVYLHGPAYIKRAYRREGGMAGFYAHMYPEGGAVEGYLVAAASFLESVFTTRAREALGLARAGLATAPEGSVPERLRREADRLEFALGES
jgi:hypothetical protein